MKNPKKRSVGSPVGSMDLTLLDAIPYYCFSLDAEGRIGYANSAILHALGRKKKDLVGRPLADLLLPKSREVFRTAHRKCAAESVPVAAEISLLNGQAEGQNLHAWLAPLGTTAGSEEIAVIVTGRDISTEKRKDLDLVRFYNLAQKTVNPLEITDTEGQIIYVNPAFEKASGYSRSELIGKNPNIFSSGKHSEIFWKKMWETITSGRVWTGEIENRKKNGEAFHTDLLISPIVDNDGTVVGYFGIHRDITQQKYLEKQLIQAQKMESMGLLTAGIAHEVGNPLTSISSLVQVLERTTDDTFVKDKLELIKNQVNRISRIIRDLVDFSRRSNYEIELTDINVCVREAISIVGVAKKARAIRFENEPGEHLPRLALVADQIQQVLVNVFINAVDAVDEKFMNVAAEKRAGKIRCRTFLDDIRLVIEISDNGKGISEGHLVKIFEPFFTTKQVGEGTGLGLWVSYGIIKSFQGDIGVQSTVGKGTTVTITLPLHTNIR